MTLEVPPQYQKNRGGRPPGPRPIADRVVRLQMAAAAARLYPKVLAFWEEVLKGTATCEQDGKKFLKYTTEDRLEATRMIMAYGFGKPVQPLTGGFQEQVHKILEIRWKEPDPNDRSKPAEHLEGLNAAAERDPAREMAGTLEKLGESGVEE